MADLLNDNPDVMNSLLRALCDPGQITDRAPLETLESWQRRAVVEHAAPYIAAAERERIAARMDELAANYPGDVFPPDSDVRDAISGTAMRQLRRARGATDG